MRCKRKNIKTTKTDKGGAMVATAETRVGRETITTKQYYIVNRRNKYLNGVVFYLFGF